MEDKKVLKLNLSYVNTNRNFKNENVISLEDIRKMREDIKEGRERGRGITDSPDKNNITLVSSSENGIVNYVAEKLAGNFIEFGNSKEVSEDRKRRNRNGENIENVYNTLKNFEASEISSKLNLTYMAYDIANYEKGKILESHGISYRVLDAKKGKDETVTALTLENMQTGKIEIVFKGSVPKGQEEKQPDEWKGREKIDWENNFKSVSSTTESQYEALEYVKEMKKKFPSMEIDCLMGHSKGGGEAIFVASHMNLRALVNDPAPVAEPGPYIGNGRLLAFAVKNNAGFLNKVSRIGDTGLYTLNSRFLKNIKGKILTGRLPVIPSEGLIRKKDYGYYIERGTRVSSHDVDPVSAEKDFMAAREGSLYASQGRAAGFREAMDRAVKTADDDRKRLGEDTPPEKSVAGTKKITR